MALHDELLTTMVVYIGRLATAGQFPLLREIGLSPQQIEKVKALSLAEMNELSSLGSRFMDIKGKPSTDPPAAPLSAQSFF